jgi:hypothetical protein
MSAGRDEQERADRDRERADCYEPVWLTSDMYDERRSESWQPLILPGHEHPIGEVRSRQGA